MKTTIYHNQNCSKSCSMIDKLQEMKVDFDVVEYLSEPPSVEDLTEIIKLLGIPAVELVRKNEKIFVDKFEGKTLTEQEWIEAMVAFPILIERPIVIHGNKAALGRPVEKVLDLF